MLAQAVRRNAASSAGGMLRRAPQGMTGMVSSGHGKRSACELRSLLGRSACEALLMPPLSWISSNFCSSFSFIHLPLPQQATTGTRRAYHENIVDHYENPRNVGSLDKSDPNVGTVRFARCGGGVLALTYFYLLHLFVLPSSSSQTHHSSPPPLPPTH
jgi:hypothetical protein